jgi:hypothetical protein
MKTSQTEMVSASTSFVEPVAPPACKSDAKPLNAKNTEASRFSHSSPPRESDSSKRTTAAVKSQSLQEKKRVARVASNTSNIVASASQ